MAGEPIGTYSLSWNERWNAACFAILIGFCVVIIIGMGFHGERWAFGLAVCLLVPLARYFWGYVAGGCKLIVTKRGFIVVSSFRRTAFFWSDVEKFRMWKFPIFSLATITTLRRDDYLRVVIVLSKAGRRRLGSEDANFSFPSTFGFEFGEFLIQLEHWRKTYSD